VKESTFISSQASKPYRLTLKIPLHFPSDVTVKSFDARGVKDRADL
jgi:hypothetical protein